MGKRVFLIILDSFGVGHAPDAAEFGDEGSNTLAAIAKSPKFHTPHLQSLGLFNIDGVEVQPKAAAPAGCYGRMTELSRGKDTTIGHWEIAGVESPKPLPTFPDGFPQEMLEEYAKRTGRTILCNKPYSGTDVIRDYGAQQMETGGLIVYTSADSVFQVAANEAVVPLDELYRCCAIAREMLVGDLAVGRVIARPFEGTAPDNFKRTAGRHDYSLTPPKPTILDALKAAGKDVISVGKIYDIFAGQGLTQKVKSTNNTEGMERTLELAGQDFEGLAFINLVDFDMVYGHRNDVDGYAAAMSAFDVALGKLLPKLRENDLLMITADHGCDPSTPSTDHSRERVPLLVAGPLAKPGVNLGTLDGFGCVANTIAEAFGLPASYVGHSLWNEVSGAK